jgi:hypothetical protein
MIPITKDNQELNNFHYNNGRVIWEFVNGFNNSDSIAVVQWFKNEFKINEDNPNWLKGTTHKIALPYQKAGYSSMNLILLLKHPCEVFFYVEFKEDRYKISVNQIIWYPDIGVNYGSVQTNSNLNMTLEEIALMKKGYSSTFVKKTSVQLNDILKVMFKANPIVRNNNW